MKPKFSNLILFSVVSLDPADLVFGGTLDLQIDKEGKPIPSIVELCCKQVEALGLDSQGIYRLSGNASTIQRLKAMANRRTIYECFFKKCTFFLIIGL
jgi:hypothetical protein